MNSPKIRRPLHQGNGICPAQVPATAPAGFSAFKVTDAGFVTTLPAKYSLVLEVEQLAALCNGLGSVFIRFDLV
jgi:hypothetical protein